LLFLTKLGPWTILIEKLLSRLIPMGTLLLLCLPLQALAYSLGGVSPTMLWGSMWMLLVVMVQTATLALACSCWFRTTSAAFISSYCVGFLMLFGPFAMIMIVALLFNDFRGPFPLQPFFNSMKSLGIVESEEQLLFPFFGAIQFFATATRGLSGSLGRIVIVSIPSMMTCVVFLVAARMFLVKRAFAAPFNPLVEAFRGIESGLDRVNQATRSPTLIRRGESTNLPVEHPIAWRETEKRSIGRTRHIPFVILLIVLPMLGLLWLGLIRDYEWCFGIAMLLTPVVWFGGLVTVAVRSVSLIAGERSHQTLDVLSTLPITGKEILLQKFKGISRLIYVIWVPLALLMTVSAIFRSSWLPSHFSVGGRLPPQVIPYLFTAALSAIVYLPMIAWMCVLIGMLVRNQGRAIITSLAAIIGWCALPFLVILLPLELLFRGAANDMPFSWAPLLSPVTLPVLNEANEVLELLGGSFRSRLYGNGGIQPSSTEIFVRLMFLSTCNFIWYGGWWFALRRICLENADRFLGRMDTVSNEYRNRPNRGWSQRMEERAMDSHTTEVPPVQTLDALGSDGLPVATEITTFVDIPPT
ncbi:MAG: hypothetical protein NT069_29945, partial [Planctomycetota bacterium]|nr:hypothetical protein [Planctomycetota bacterium]